MSDSDDRLLVTTLLHTINEEKQKIYSKSTTVYDFRTVLNARHSINLIGNDTLAQLMWEQLVGLFNCCKLCIFLV